MNIEGIMDVKLIHCDIQKLTKGAIMVRIILIRHGETNGIYGRPLSGPGRYPAL